MKNEAAERFLKKGEQGQTQAEYGTWYEPDTVRGLCDPISKTGVINYIFFDDVNPDEAFKVQLTRVRSLIEKLARASVVEADTSTICFISKEPGIGQNHFIFCMLSREKDGTYKFLIINPTGESRHKDFYTGLIEFEKQIDVTIYITRTVIQKDEGKEGIVSCGPICVELLNHISSLPVGQVNIILNGSNKESKTKGEGENAVTYNAIDVRDVLLPISLKRVIKAGAEEYKQSIIGIRESHLKSLEQESTEAVNIRVHGQKLLNKFVLGEGIENEKSIVNQLLDISKAAQAPNKQLKGIGIKASNNRITIIDNDELIAQQEELELLNMGEDQDRLKRPYVNSFVVSTFQNVDTQTSKNKDLDEQSSIDKAKIDKKLDKVTPLANDITPKSSSKLALNKVDYDKSDRTGYEENKLQSKLKSEYAKKDSLPKILEDEDFPVQKIDDIYVNLMLIAVEKDQDEGDRSKRKEEKEKAYGAYEEIVAKKTEIDLENIFDSKLQSDNTIKEVNKVLIYGRAGIGKTTLCNYISYKWAQPVGSEKQQGLWKEKFDYVFWLPLRNLSGDWYTLHQNDIGKYALECFIWRYCLGRDDGFSIQDISRVIKEGKVLLILDGYDEIASFHNKNHTAIKDVIDSAIGITNKQAKVIMTSRPNAVSQAMVNKFDAEIENVGLKKEDVYEYVRKYGFKEKEKMEGLLSLVEQHGHMESIAGVPINLYLLCLTWDKGVFKEQIGITTTGLYNEVTSWLMKRYLGKSKEKKLVEIEFDGVEEVCGEEYKLLVKLAYLGVKKKTAILRREEFQELHIKWEKLSELKKLGILPGRGTEEGTKEYEFIHLTFQEYFAACHIVELLGSGDLGKIKEGVKFINENKYNQAYERVILFIAGLVTLGFEKQNDEQGMKHFWNVMVNGKTDLGGLKQIELLISCLEEGRCRKEIPGIDKILRGIKEYSLKNVYRLKQSLNMSLQVLNKSGIIRSLICKLNGPNGEKVRNAAAEALGELKVGTAELKKVVAEALCNALEDEDGWARSAAAFALEKLNIRDVELTKTVVESLCKTLGDWDSEVRRAAASALGELKLRDVELTKSVVEALSKALGDDNKGARRAAASALEKLNLKDVEPTKTVVIAMCKVLRGWDSEVRSAAAFALGELKLRDEELTKAVVKSLYKALRDWDSEVHRAADSALKKLKLRDKELTKTVVRDLCKHLEDKDALMFSAADSVLEKNLIDVELTKIVVEVLCKALGYDDKWVRRAAAYALNKLNLRDVALTEALVRGLYNAFGGEDKWVRHAAASALEKLNLIDVELTNTAVEALCKALGYDDKRVRHAAASALEKLNLIDVELTNTAVEALCKALGYDDKRVRHAAASALEKLNLRDVELTNTAVEALCKALGYDDKWVCHAAASALEKLNLRDVELTNTAVEALCKALGDDKWVRSAAVNVLGALKLEGVKLAKTVVESLCKILGGEDKLMRRATASALNKLNIRNVELTKIVIEALCKALGDKNEETRRAAAYTLGELNLEGVELAKIVVEALCKTLEGKDEETGRATAYALGKLNLEDVELAKTVVRVLRALGDDDKGVRRNAAYALGELKLGDVELTKPVVEALSKVLVDKDERVRRAAADALVKLELGDMELTKPMVGVLCEALQDYDREVNRVAAKALGALRLGDEELIKIVVESLYKTLGNPDKEMSYYGKSALNKVLAQCVINNIKLFFTKQIIKLLERSDIKVFQESAIVLNNSYLTLHYGERKLEFEFDKSDKELPLQVWKHFRGKAEKEGLPIEMLDSLRTGSKWIKIEGIEPEIDKLISNRITIEDIMIIKDNIELSIIPGADTLNKELILACTSENGPQSAIKNYLIKNNSLYTGDKKYQSPILMAAMALTYEKPEHIKQLDSVIKVLCKKSVGLSAVDGIGNTVAHYAVRYHRKDVLDACIDSGDYSKEVVNTYGVNILHTAVYHNMIGELDNKLGEQNLDFDKQAESGKYTFTPIELAVATGGIEAIEKIWDMNRSIAAASEWCRRNILNVAIEFKKDEVLHYLIYEKKYKISPTLVQDAYVYAAVSKGEGNINAMRILQLSFVKMYKDCSISKYSYVTGNTALHEVVNSEEMEIDKKCVVINYLLGQEVGLADTHNKNNQTVKELASKLAVGDKKGEYTRIINILNTKKNIQDSKKHEMPELGKVPIKNLILKGGWPNGIAYVGALREFEKKQKEGGWSEIERVAGTSAGAITAGLYAIGYSAQELEKDLAGIKLIELLDNTDVDKLMKLKSVTSPWTVISSLFNEQGSGGHKLLFKIIKALGEYNGLCAGKKFEEIIEGFIEKKTGKKNFTLGDLGEKVRKGEKGYKELYVVTLNILNAEDPLVILSTEEENYREIRLADVIRASMSIPIVFEPKEIEYRDKKSGEYKVLRCIDGGLMYNYPIDIFDKVKFRYTGIRGEGQKPIYNEYTMGLSLHSKEIEEKQEIKTKEKKEKMTIGQIAMKDAVSVAEGVFKWATTEDLGEIRKGVGKIKKVALQIMNILYKAEEVMSKYWEDSIKVRTVEIDSCGVTLLDFDLSEDVINKLMREGAIAVNKKFGMDIVQGAPATIDMQRLTGSVHEVTQKSSRGAININTNNTYTSTSSLNTHNMHNISEDRVPQVMDLDDDIQINIKGKQVRSSGDCWLF